jgi:hypothetical protein
MAVAMFLISIGAMVMGEVSIMPMLRLMEYMFFVFLGFSIFWLDVVVLRIVCVLYLYMVRKGYKKKKIRGISLFLYFKSVL